MKGSKVTRVSNPWVSAVFNRWVIVLSLLAAVCPCRADQAVVVGVQEYAPLISASTLRGCINDATAIKALLEKNGFKVTFLTNEKATKQGILDAIAACGKTMKHDERFVFYFAGHGRRVPHPALMPHDATSDGNDLTTDELNAAMLKVPAKSRTVILDACFSGGMAAGVMARGLESDPFHLEARFWDPPAEQSRSLDFGPPPQPANNQDTNAKLENGTGICYYTACTSNEEALEGTFENERHGLFTWALISNLKDDSQSWLQVHDEVKSEMQQKLANAGRQQNPTISKDYINSHALDNNVSKPVPPAPTKNLIDVWNMDNPDASKISINMDPNQTGYEAGRKIHMTVKVGQEGYLVILGQVDGQFYQFYPHDSYSSNDAHVMPGQIQFPTAGNDLFFDAFGADQVKAILFSNPEKAQEVLQTMQSMQGATVDQAAGRDLVMARSLNEPDYTSRVSVAVSDNLIGGLRFKNLDGLVKTVGLHADPVSQRLWNLVTAAATYPKAKQWAANTDFNAPLDTKSRQQFVTLLNLALQNGSIYDETAFAGVKLSAKTAALLKQQPSGDDLLKLNRMLLVAAYPDLVNPDGAAGGSK
ncbi:MAG TPA: caspase family protein [Fimbriimonadaceae bacterium]|nr:caspase family protein [Fimbriimonadaceae bacterium]